MYILLSFMLILINMLFMTSSTPLSMGLSIIAQTFILALMSGLILPSFWYSYILVLTFLGGLLVLFIYVSSLAPNEKLNFSMKNLFLLSILSIMVFIMVEKNYPMKNNDNLMKNEFFSWMYSKPIEISSVFLMIYLFVVLVAVVKITKWWGGAIRPMN